MRIGFKVEGLEEMRAAVAAAGRKLPNELSATLNKANKGTQADTSNLIREDIVILKRDVKKQLVPMPRANRRTLRTGFIVEYGRRIPLRDFKPRQNKKGVSYKTRPGPRKHIKSAFMGPTPKQKLARWKGHVMVRDSEARTPVWLLRGPSVWGVFVKNRLSRRVYAIAEARMAKELENRIRFNVLKAEGL